MSQPRDPDARAARRGVYLGIGSTAVCFVLELFGISGFHALAFVFVPGTLLTLGVCVLISLDLPRFRAITTQAIHTLGYALALFLLSYPLSFLGHRISVARAKDRAQPLISALYAYQAHHAEPAPNIEALVPELLPGIPTTGRFSSESFHYQRFEANGSRPATWNLTLSASRFFFGPDFVYTPPDPDSFTGGGWREDRW